MANFGLIVEWILRLEDRTLAGKTENLGDGAGLTRFGLTTRDEGAALPQSFWTDEVQNDAALEMAKQVYYDRYWSPIRGAQIASDELAATLMSFVVNDGVAAAVRLLQGILGVQQDGIVGPGTLAAISAVDADGLTERLRDAQEARYRTIVAHRPEDARFLNGWVNRARARYPDLP